MVQDLNVGMMGRGLTELAVKSITGYVNRALHSDSEEKLWGLMFEWGALSRSVDASGITDVQQKELVERVQWLKYLGKQMVKDEAVETEVSCRINAASEVLKALHERCDAVRKIGIGREEGVVSGVVVPTVLLERVVRSEESCEKKKNCIWDEMFEMHDKKDGDG